MKPVVGVCVALLLFATFALLFISIAFVQPLSLACELKTHPIPIDFVVTWVDGNDAEYNSLRRHHWSLQNWNSHSYTSNRFVDQHTLKYVLRSVERYAPWIRKVFILTSNHQRPAWLQTSERCVLVNDSEIVDVDSLPLFNSHAFECVLDRIPGLAEYFFYSCDDMFFGRPCLPHDFVQAGKLQLFQDLFPNKMAERYNRVDHQNAWLNNQRLLSEKLGVKVQETPQHVVTILSRSMMQKAREHFPDEWAATAASKFRLQANIHPVGLTQYVAVHEKQAEWVRYWSGTHLCISSRDNRGLWNIQLFALRILRPKLFCVNDDTTKPNRETIQSLEKTLEYLFPTPSPFEKR